MAIGGWRNGCTCQGPWHIGVPFDHPIWQSIIRRCPVHGHQVAAAPCCPCGCHIATDNTTNTSGVAS